MYGIYKIENGLHFMGIVTETEQKAIEYLSNLYGKWEEYPAKDWTPNNRRYIRKFIPYYNKEVFKIKEVSVII